MKRFVTLSSLVITLWWGTPLGSPAFQKPAQAPLPNFDKRLVGTPDQPKPGGGHAAEAARLKEQVRDTRIDMDRILGRPAFVAAQHGFLSGPNGPGKGVSVGAWQAIPAKDPHRVTKAFLHEHPGLFGHGPEVLDAAEIKQDYVTAHNGLRTTIWQQSLDGIRVDGAILKSHVTGQGELVSLFSRCVPNLARAAHAGVPNRVTVQASPPISASQAIVLAAEIIGDQVLLSQVVAQDAQSAGAPKRQRFSARPALKGDVTVNLAWLPMSSDVMRLCWQLYLESGARGEGFKVLVDAQTGEVLVRECRTAYLSDASYRVYTNESPSPFLPGHPTPQAGQPPYVERVLLVTPALDTNASPNGWIDDGVNETMGNNVDAHTDRDRNNQPDLPRPQGNPNRVFDFPMDLATQDPTNYSAAAVVQLFYYCNWYHDRLYQLGFTEAAGNFQMTNFGRGGLGGDAVLADAQDGGGFNNANFGTPPDGQPGRMQMYIFDQPNPHRDGDFDGLIVLHEHTHGLSWRLVAGGDALGSLQSDGMGEGWSDFYPFALLAPTNADPNACYPEGGYVTYQFYGLQENYYYGIRRYPYSTDMSKNPLTFKDIDPSQADPHPGVPISPLGFEMNGADEVHNQGEVWCMVLWEMRANLIAKYGGAAGNQLALQLVTDGMKLAPAQPNFLQARDAIVQADLINNGYANFDEIWRAFAKRGMGGSASSPDSSSTIGVVEAFDIPGLALQSAKASDLFTGNANGSVDPNECNELTVVLINNGRTNATSVNATLTPTTPGVVMSQADSPYPDILPFTTATNLVAFRFYTLPNLVCGTPILFDLQLRTDQESRTIKVRLPTGQIGTPVRFDNNTPVAIPDANPAGVDSPITVSGFDSAVAEATVSLHITHPFVFDLEFRLVGPDGTSVTLVQNLPWASDDFGLNCTPDSARTTFDDKGTISIGAAFPPFVGTFKPMQPLAKLQGKSGSGVNGVWKLHVIDWFFQDVGTVQCWSLVLSPSVCTDGGGDCSTDLALSGTSAPAIPFVGTNITYTFVVTNLGANAGRNTVFSDPLPARTTFVSASSTRGSCTLAGATVNCSLGNLASAASATVNVVVRPNPDVLGLVTNVATVTTTTLDNNLTNNTVILITRVLPASPLVVSAGALLVSESVNPPNGGLDPGEVVSLDLALQNIGSQDTANLVATLLAANGVTAPSGPQTYGALRSGGAPVTNRYSFTATGTNGGTVTATLQLRDGTNVLPDASFVFGLSSVTALTNQSQIRLPDVGPATNLYPSSITIRGLSGMVRKVTATLLNVQHTAPDDLDVLLVGPKGDTVLLMSDAGGGSGISGVNLTFDDAGALLPDSSTIASGSYRPTDFESGDTLPAPAPAGPYGSALSVFDGGDPNGTWSLYVADDLVGESGRIAGGWALSITTVDPVNTTADLKVVGSGSPNPVALGSNLTYIILVTNLGPDTASEVVLTNTLPAGTTFVSAQLSLGTFTNLGSRLVCSLGTMTNQAQAALSIVVTATRSGTLTNVATIVGRAQDPNALNSRATILNSVIPEADLAVSIAAPASTPVNDTLVYSISVTNPGPDRATGVYLTNQLAATLTNVTVLASQGSCSLVGSQVICNLLTVTNGTRATVTVQAVPLALGAITSTATIRSLSPIDTVLTNNTAVSSTTVTDPYVILVPDGSTLLSEGFTPPSGGLDPNETVTLNLRLRNVGVSNSTDLVATLRNTGGVTAPSGPQNYGVVPAGGPGVARPFTFTAVGTAGGTVTATLDLRDGTNDLGTVVYAFALGGAASFANPARVSIPDNSVAVPYPSSIVVSNLNGVVGKVTVTLNGLSHAYPDDLDVLLVSPDGHAALLMSDAGGGNRINYVTLTFDDAAATSLPNDTQVTSGTYKPSDFPPADVFPAPAPAGPYTAELSVLNHGNPNGTWSLFVQDDWIGDLGALEGGWSLNITTVGFINPPPQPPRLADPVLLRNGHFQFTLKGDPGFTYLIEASDDLKSWAQVGELTLSGETGPFEDSDTASHPYRFYRVRLKP